MKEIELGEVQEKFAEIIWELEPISSGELVRVCQERLNWKKPTTYTVLRTLCEKGLFENKDSVVHARISKAEYDAKRSERFVEESFGGSLPAFVAAFTAQKKLSKDEVDELQAMIDKMKEGKA